MTTKDAFDIGWLILAVIWAFSMLGKDKGTWFTVDGDDPDGGPGLR